MRAREFKAARLACVAANREAVEHNLQKLYRLMGWPEFSHIIYAQTPNVYARHAHRSSFHPIAQERARELNDSLSLGGGNSLDPWRNIFPAWSRSYSHRLRADTPTRKVELRDIWRFLQRELLDFSPHRHTPVALEKPVEVHFDDSDRPHRMDGPAVIWRDGRRDYWVNGVRATRRFVEEPPTVAYINRQDNAERKRLLMERFGEDKYLKAMKAELRQEDETGKLWRIPAKTSSRRVAGGWSRWTTVTTEALQFVQVTNSTAEPDGSFNKYFLCVPPHVKTAREAVAWTFRIPKDKKGRNYRPKAET